MKKERKGEGRMGQMWHTKPYADIFAGMKVLHMACRSFADFKLGALQCEHSETHDTSSPCFLFLSGYCCLFRQRLYNRGRKVNHQSRHRIFFSRHWPYVPENVRNMQPMRLRQNISCVATENLLFFLYWAATQREVSY